MKKSVVFAVIALFVTSLGCGPTATDTSGSAPVQTEEDTTQELEKAMESGEIDPAAYGQQ